MPLPDNLFDDIPAAEAPPPLSDNLFDDIPKADKTSWYGAAVRSFAPHVLPNVAFGYTMAGAMPAITTASAALGPAAPVAGVLGGVAIGSVASKAVSSIQSDLTDLVLPEASKEKLAKWTAEDRDLHPAATFIGELAAALPAFRLSPHKTFKALAQLPKVLRGTLPEAERQAAKALFLKDAAIPLGLGASLGAVQPLLSGHLPTARDVAMGAISAGLFGEPYLKPKIPLPPPPFTPRPHAEPPPETGPLEAATIVGDQSVDVAENTAATAPFRGPESMIDTGLPGHSDLAGVQPVPPVPLPPGLETASQKQGQPLEWGGIQKRAAQEPPAIINPPAAVEPPAIIPGQAPPNPRMIRIDDPTLGEVYVKAEGPNPNLPPLTEQLPGDYPPTAEQLGTFQSHDIPHPTPREWRSPQPIVPRTDPGVVSPESLRYALPERQATPPVRDVPPEPPSQQDLPPSEGGGGVPPGGIPPAPEGLPGGGAAAAPEAAPPVPLTPPPGVLPPEPSPAAPPSTVGRAVSRSMNRPPDLIDFIKAEVGRIRSKSAATSPEGLYEEGYFQVQKMRWSKDILGPSGTITPDAAAEAAFKKGLIPEATADALWKGLLKAGNGRRTGAGRESAMLEREMQDTKEWLEMASKGRGKNPTPVASTSLQVGDTFTVKGVPVKVVEVTPDTAYVQSTRFGRQQVPATFFFDAGTFQRGKLRMTAREVEGLGQWNKANIEEPPPPAAAPELPKPRAVGEMSEEEIKLYAELAKHARQAGRTTEADMLEDVVRKWITEKAPKGGATTSVEAPESVSLPPAQTAQTAKPETPTIKSGQNQGDLLGGPGAEMPFNLAGETTQSGERIAAERAEAEASATAKAENEAKNQGTLPGVIKGTPLEQWADRVINEDPRGGKTRMSLGIDPGDPRRIAAWAIKGAALIEGGLRDFVLWSDAMVKQFGPSIRPRLNGLFSQAMTMANGGPAPAGAPGGPATGAPTAPGAVPPILGLPPAGARPAGTVMAPTSVAAAASAQRGFVGGVRDLWRSAALKAVPRMTDHSQALGEKATRYAVAIMVAREKGLIFAQKVLEGLNIDPDNFGAALVEDNLRALRQSRTDAAAAAQARGEVEKARELGIEANKVIRTVGLPGSPFPNEATYQAFLSNPETQMAIERHKQLWVEQKDPLFRQAMDLDPNAVLETRGLQTGARINLKALDPNEAGIAPVSATERKTPAAFRQMATIIRKDPFGRRATGASQAYEQNYTELIGNGFEREYPIAKQHDFIKEMIHGGGVNGSVATVSTSQMGPEGTTARLLTLKPYTGKFLHVPKDLLNEFDAVSGLEKPAHIRVITPLAQLLTKNAIAGVAEGSTHVSNLMTQAFTGLGPTSHPMLNALLKTMSRSDLLITLPRVLIKGMENNREAMLKLAEIGAAKEPYQGKFIAPILNIIDKGVRLHAAEIYKGMAEKGWVENSETGLREYVNQVGNYSKRLQPGFVRKLRESGISPFITAGMTFNNMGLRRMVMAPGAKATSNSAALALRADIAAGWMGAGILVTALNMLVSGKPTGPTGTPLGAVGWVDKKDGKVHNFNLLRYLGFERGLRITGVGPAIEAKRLGVPLAGQLGAASKSVASAGLNVIAGPLPRFAFLAATGLRPTQPWVREALPVAPYYGDNPLRSQVAKNIETALIESNPVASSIHQFYKDRSLEEVLADPVGTFDPEQTGKVLEKQLGRFTPREGLTEEAARRMPEIDRERKIKDYSDGLAQRSRSVPLSKRAAWLDKTMRSDKVDPRDWRKIREEVKKHGILRYQ